MNTVDFSFVYIAEAHATDEWSIHSSRSTIDGLPVEIMQPITLDARVTIARNFVNSYGMNNFHLLVDNPEKISDSIDGDQFEKQFAPWPLRFYILGDGLVQWIASPSDGTFPIEDLKVALRRCAHEIL